MQSNSSPTQQLSTQLQQQLTQDFVSKSPSPNVESSNDVAFSIQINPIPYRKSNISIVVPQIIEQDLMQISVEEKRMISEQQRQNLITNNQINHIKQIKQQHLEQQQLLDNIINREKNQNQGSNTRSYFLQQQRKQKDNAELEAKRAIVIENQKQQQKQLDDLVLQNIVNSKLQQSKPKNQQINTKQVGETLSQQRLTMRQKQILNQKADIITKRNENLQKMLQNQKQEQINHIKLVKLTKQAEIQQIQQKIKEEKENPAAVRHKLLLGNKKIEFNYTVNQKQNLLLKQQALQLKQKYSQLEMEQKLSRKQRKHDQNVRLQWRNQKQEQNKREYIEQLESNINLDNIRYQNNFERQAVTNQQLQDHLQNKRAQKAILQSTKTEQQDSLKEPQKQSLSMSFYNEKKINEMVIKAE